MYDAFEIKQIHDYLCEHGLKWVDYVVLRDLAQSTTAISLAEASRWTSIGTGAIRQYLPILEELEGIYLSAYRGRPWMVYASDAEAALCREREISLMEFSRLVPVLQELREELQRYYQRTQFQDWRGDNPGMIEIKRRWVERLVRVTRRSKGHVRRIIRTWQDLVLMELGIPREYAEQVLELNGECELDLDEDRYDDEEDDEDE